MKYLWAGLPSTDPLEAIWGPSSKGYTGLSHRHDCLCVRWLGRLHLEDLPQPFRCSGLVQDVVHVSYVTGEQSVTYRSVWSAEMSLVGPRFLFRGLSLNLVKSFVRTGITMYTYSTSKAWLTSSHR
eukprot:gnl/TRDRNA2_/TRDRNA2_162454_c0_seq8.p2 gnl/TRDRNA2_/TRDRNA2_162454_c0~~gnl/TRDRNA2_/TRDRNA2_162454_c0_seq8.p2  ORF type:complete len:126 (+),score=3.74 gnl/TRDRNA2_/TRDRNA2_162454_c0_seq8:561-938(+)